MDEKTNEQHKVIQKVRINEIIKKSRTTEITNEIHIEFQKEITNKGKK